MQEITEVVSSGARWPCCVRKAASHSTLSRFPDLAGFQCLLLRHCRGLGAADVDAPFRPEHSTVTYYRHFGQLWVSALTIFQDRKKLLWPESMAPLTHVNKHEYLEGSLMFFLFLQNNSSGFSLLQGYLSNGLWPVLQYQAWTLSCGETVFLIQK